MAPLPFVTRRSKKNVRCFSIDHFSYFSFSPRVRLYSKPNVLQTYSDLTRISAALFPTGFIARDRSPLHGLLCRHRRLVLLLSGAISPERVRRLRLTSRATSCDEEFCREVGPLYSSVRRNKSSPPSWLRWPFSRLAAFTGGRRTSSTPARQLATDFPPIPSSPWRSFIIYGNAAFFRWFVHIIRLSDASQNHARVRSVSFLLCFLFFNDLGESIVRSCDLSPHARRTRYSARWFRRVGGKVLIATIRFQRKCWS